MKKGKNNYTFAEDEIMKQIVNNRFGNPANVSFWTKAKSHYQGLERHSSESLRAHWRYFCNNSLSVTSSENKESEIIESENKKSKLIESENKENTDATKEGKMTFEEWLKSDQRSEDFPKDNLGFNDICEFFNEIVATCQRHAGCNLEAEAVVKVLDKNSGSVSKTIKHFEESPVFK